VTQAALLHVAVDARSLLCAQPRGEGKSLLRLYQELAHRRPQLRAVLCGDAAARHYRGPLPEGARVVATERLGDRFGLWERLWFPWAARRHGCTLMHCASSSAPPWCGLPMVLTVHDVIPLLFDDGQDARQKQRFASGLRHGLRQARGVICVSECTRADLARTMGVGPETLSVVPWGADRVADADLSAPEAPPRVLVFGGEARRKNTPYALERVIAAARRVPALCATFVGVTSARQRDAVEARLAEAGLAERVELPGYLSDDALARLLRTSSVALYLSEYEGFGLPVVEAIGAGTPVIASDRASIPEVLQGAPGCMALSEPEPIENLIVAVTSDPGARARLLRAQREVVQRFDWARTAELTEQVLDRAAQRRPVATPAAV
jgi:glycosyltransferase involved in cell wall biosynthesis